MTFQYLSKERRGDVFVITMRRAPENRLNVQFCQELIRAFREVEKELGPGAEGAVILRGSDAKFFCTGVDLDEREGNIYASSDGFYPLLHTILDFPFPTIALITGHTFGGAGVLTLTHDYRVMNSKRGYWSMPPIVLGLHHDGIGSLARLKLPSKTARKILMEAYKFTGKEALEYGIVDAIAPPDEMLDKALEIANMWKGKAKMGVYSLLRKELWGEATGKYAAASYVHGRETSSQPKMKL